MAGEMYSLIGKACRLGRAIPVETEEMRSQISLKIQALYDAGFAFFTRDAIRDIYRQIRASSKEGQKISVRGLDGVTVNFDVESGRILESPDPDLQYIVQAPFIFYRSLRDLTTLSAGVDPNLVYCNLQICHGMVLQNKLTKELVNTFPVQSFDAVEQFFKASLQAWKDSESCKQLRSTLHSTMNLRNISKIIAFACGPISPGSQDPLARWSAFQRALLFTLKDILINGTRVLEKAGIIVLDDPEAFLEVENILVMVSCGPDVPVREIITDIAQPAVMIWDRVKEDETAEKAMYGEKYTSTDPVSPRVIDTIHNHYEEVEFPDDKEHFGNIAIYLRRAATA